MSKKKDTNIVQIRKKGGLHTIAKTKNGGKLHPMLYHTKTKDPKEDGIPEGDYRGGQILDTKHFLSPHWSDLKKQWAFSGSAEDLARLIKAMKLKYPKNHQREGSYIEPGANVADRLIDRQDIVFNHPEFYGKYFMENGRASLNLSDPRQEFLHRCYKGDTATEDGTQKGPKNKFIAAGTKYKIVSPKRENVLAKQDADKEVKAIMLLAGMNNDEDRMRSVARIMDLPQYSDATDLNGVFLLLKENAAQNAEISSKYKKSYQDRFIELSEMSDADLAINDQVIRARKKGILRKRNGYYLFNGERVEGLETDNQLVNYFRNPANQEDYLKLDDLLRDSE